MDLLILVLPRIETHLGTLDATVTMASVAGIIARPFAGWIDLRNLRIMPSSGAALVALRTIALVRTAPSGPLVLGSMSGAAESFLYVGLAAPATGLGVSTSLKRRLSGSSLGVSVDLLSRPPICEIVRSDAGYARVRLTSAVYAAVAAGCSHVVNRPVPSGGHGAGGRLAEKAALWPAAGYLASVWVVAAFSTDRYRPSGWPASTLNLAVTVAPPHSRRTLFAAVIVACPFNIHMVAYSIHNAELR